MSVILFLIVIIHATLMAVVGVWFPPPFVCVSKTDAVKSTNLLRNVEKLHYRSWKSIYFGAKHIAGVSDCCVS